MLAPRESRRLQRTRFTAEQHFDALDADADEMEAVFADMKAEIHGMRAVLIGLLVSLAVASVALAANVVLKTL